jgi:hypothetical protein
VNQLSNIIEARRRDKLTALRIDIIHSFDVFAFDELWHFYNIMHGLRQEIAFDSEFVAFS